MEGQAIDTEKPVTEEVAGKTSPEEDVDEKVEPEMDLPSALVKLEEANRKIRDVNRESASRRKEIAELKVQLQNNGLNKDEVATKLTELQGQLKNANEKVRMVELRDRFDAVVAKAKIPFINQIANRDAFTFAHDPISKLPDDATDDDVLDIVKDVVKLRPHLLNKPMPPNINAEAKGTSDALAGLDMEGIARDFGITNR